MDTTAVGGGLVEYSKEQLFWAFQFLSAAVWTRVLKLKRIVESENGYGHGRTGRLGCAGFELLVSTTSYNHFVPPKISAGCGPG